MTHFYHIAFTGITKLEGDFGMREFASAEMRTDEPITTWEDTVKICDQLQREQKMTKVILLNWILLRTEEQSQFQKSNLTKE